MKSYKLLEDLAVSFLNTRDKLYLVDGYLGSAPDHRLKVRCICSRTYHALLISNSLFKPSKAQL
jgi:phosphoenolpyruvate carboxykinase (ATP)